MDDIEDDDFTFVLAYATGMALDGRNRIGIFFAETSYGQVSEAAPGPPNDSIASLWVSSFNLEYSNLACRVSLIFVHLDNVDATCVRQSYAPYRSPTTPTF